VTVLLCFELRSSFLSVVVRGMVIRCKGEVESSMLQKHQCMQCSGQCDDDALHFRYGTGTSTPEQQTSNFTAIAFGVQKNYVGGYDVYVVLQGVIGNCVNNVSIDVRGV
jgi:hypothetical protein